MWHLLDQAYLHSFNNYFLYVARKVVICAFDGSEIHCKELYSVLQQSNPGIFDQTKRLDTALLSDGTKSGFKPLVLLPGRMECCGKKVVIR